MELYEIKSGLEKARLLLEELHTSADIDGKKREIEGLTVKTLDEHFWDDQKKATKIYNQLNEMKKVTDAYDELMSSLSDLEEIYDYVKSNEDDEEFRASLEEEYETFSKKLTDFERDLLFTGKYDNAAALIDIHPGAGGTESQDWAEMLMRMYMRYGERKGWKVSVEDYEAGDEAGVKAVTLRLAGSHAYGMMKSENGVHRLVRISPFDANKRRHTSFASVEVLPEIDDDIEVTIDPKDIRIDTYRSSGAGGQHINKTDSAVRITHLPTHTVVTCQSQRSQLMNRETAMTMLKSKLYALMQAQHAQKLSDIAGEKKAIEWGSQIRSYVLHPYSLVKDNRSGYESHDPQGILDGDLDDMIYAYLKAAASKENSDE